MKNLKQHTKWLAPLTVVAATCGIGLAVQGQPNPGLGAGDGPREGRPERRHEDRPDFRNMTPAQRQEWEARRNEEGLRRNLTNAGYTDKALQDAVIAYVDAQQKARVPLLEKGRVLVESVRDKTATDEQVSKQLASLRATATTVKAQREVAQNELNAKIAFSKNPKLEAYLTLLGVIDDEAALIMGGGGNRMPPPPMRDGPPPPRPDGPPDF